MAEFERIEDLLAGTPVMPIVTVPSAGAAVEIARSLIRGGIQAIEVTLRTAAGIAAIEAIARQVPEITVGAGTVLTRDDLRRAKNAGATFAVSPGTTAELLATAIEAGVLYLPGVVTASEIHRAMDMGYTCLKFFPAVAAGGVAGIAAFAAPFPQVRFCASGGITAETAQAYLELSNVIAIGGSWMAPQDLISKGDWPAIEKRARDAATRFFRKSAR